MNKKEQFANLKEQVANLPVEIPLTNKLDELNNSYSKLSTNTIGLTKSFDTVKLLLSVIFSKQQALLC